MQSLLGQKAYFICPRYIYAGTVSTVDDNFVVLTDAVLVYDTGPWTARAWSDAQPLPGGTVTIPIGAIESCGPSGK